MANIGNSIRFGLGLALLTGLAVPSAGWAQAARKGAPGRAVEIEEITVTAQRREEAIQETPISVTALTSEALQNKGVTNIADVGTAAPNVRITGSPVSNNILTASIRGLAQGNPQTAFAPKVGIYIDGAYIAQIKGSNFDLDDMERVEVLRGPQGTLYGRNTIGGAMNFITKKPTEERAITLSTEVGNYETFKGRLTFNLPLIGKNGFFQSDVLGTLSLRQTAGYKTHEGFYRNALTANMPSSPKPDGSADFSDLNRVYSFTALRWQPTRDITVDYLFEYHRYRQHATAFPLTYVYPGSPVSRPQVPSLYAVPYIQKNRPDDVPGHTIAQAGLPYTDQNRDDGNHHLNVLTGAWDVGDVGPLGSVTLQSISEYRSLLAEGLWGPDGTPLSIANINTPSEITHWSEELQWIGTAPRWRYILGGYYYGEYDMYRSRQTFFNGASRSAYKNFNKVKSYAAYGQGTWTPPILNDKLSLTAGLRFTQEQIHLDHIVTIATRGPFSKSGGKAFGGIHGPGAPGISPMGDISYQWTDELMTYVRATRGYSGGGFDPTGAIPELFKSFKPETLWAFEAGVKSQWLDNRLRLNADGFFSYYKDFQTTLFLASPTLGALSVSSNAERAEIWGMEFEATAIPFRGLEATVAYSFLAPKYTKWMDQKFDANNRPIFGPDGKPVLESVADQRAFPHSPKNQATVGLTYTAPPTTTGTFSAHLDVYWQDKVVFVANNQTAGSQADEGWAYALVNGRLAYAGIPLQKGSLDVAVFSRNLLDRKYRSYGIDFGPALGYAGNVYGDPRTFGVQLTYNYSAGAEPLAPPPAPVAQAAPPPPPAKKKIVLRSVHFDFDKATLKAEAKPILDEAVQVLKQEGSVDIIVEGHTDSVGTDQYNLGLSRRRAETVRAYLVDHGIARSRITAEGMGEAKPVASNDTADGRVQNRRVELHVR
ncbi:MAG: OmpA family protein [Candidatus Binatia bacterium]